MARKLTEWVISVTQGLAKTDVAQGLGAGAVDRHRRMFPALINAPGAVDIAVRAAASVVGADNVNGAMEPVMGSEDFAFMLEAKPGAYAFLGQAGPAGSCMVHSAHYDFNDDCRPKWQRGHALRQYRLMRVTSMAAT